MNRSKVSVAPRQSLEHVATIRSYTLGFVLSILLTLVPFSVVFFHLLSGNSLVVVVIGCATMQLYVQLRFFLHLGSGKNGQWNRLALGFMVLIVFILVAGSLWIMNNLNYHMTPDAMNEYMRAQSKKGF